MAAAYLNALAGDRYDGRSAGTEPADHPHPEVVAAMAEEGILIEDTSSSFALERHRADISAFFQISDGDADIVLWFMQKNSMFHKLNETGQ